MDRKEEVRKLARLTPDEVRKKAGDRLTVTPDLEALHRLCAERIFNRMKAAREKAGECALILPVGPTGQYRILTRMVNEARLDLKHCWFFFMDEYVGDDGRAVSEDHPLSFKGEARRLLLDPLEEGLRPAPDRVIFPDQDNIGEIPRMIDGAGGIDACYGGVGIHGHVAFNEPEDGVAEMSCRKVRLNDYTVTINSIRSHVGGNLESFPRHAFTVGMREILSADKIMLFVRNGIDLDWANMVLRVGLLGRPGEDYPVTYVRQTDYHFVTDEETLQSPRNVV